MADLNTNINIVVKNLKRLKDIKKELKDSTDLAKQISREFDRIDIAQSKNRGVLSQTGRDRYKRDAKVGLQKILTGIDVETLFMKKDN